MISSQRQRELAMQITRYLDGAQDFPLDLTEEECHFVDRLVTVQEKLLADPQGLGNAVGAAHGVVSAAAQNARNSAANQAQHLSNTGEVVENPVPDTTVKDDESTETCDDGDETIDEPRREG